MSATDLEWRCTLDELCVVGARAKIQDHLAGVQFGQSSPESGSQGPAGVSMLTLSPGAWVALDANPSSRRGSALSLRDWRDRWADAGRSALPVIPVHLETRALGAAMTRVQRGSRRARSGGERWF